MNTEHTPGPWRVDYAQGIISKDGTVVAYVEADHSDTPSPDARLIAAAPDLLEALDQIAKLYEKSEGSNYEMAFRAYDMRCIARTAIAKAEGKA